MPTFASSTVNTFALSPPPRTILASALDVLSLKVFAL